MIQGGSKISKDIPPFVMVGREPIVYVGLNVVGLRRRGYTSEKINSIQEMYRFIYQSGLNVSQATDKIDSEIPESEERKMILDFIRLSSRGIVRGNMEG
jgi:UDP-N-acetylglucosamine acyltransferase